MIVVSTTNKDKEFRYDGDESYYISNYIDALKPIIRKYDCLRKHYKWEQTTTGWIMVINKKTSWFIRQNDINSYDVCEVVSDDCGCLLRDRTETLEQAKQCAYVKECDNNNYGFDMTEAI